MFQSQPEMTALAHTSLFSHFHGFLSLFCLCLMIDRSLLHLTQHACVSFSFSIPFSSFPSPCCLSSFSLTFFSLPFSLSLSSFLAHLLSSSPLFSLSVSLLLPLSVSYSVQMREHAALERMEQNHEVIAALEESRRMAGSEKHRNRIDNLLNDVDAAGKHLQICQ